MGDTTIEWTDKVWNPVTGCDRVSAGCDNCYAERIATRFGRPFLGAVKCHSERLWYPQKWRKPRRVFVNSVSDLFHADVPDAFIAEVFAVMGICQKHTFQVLTKRPQRMAKLLADHGFWALVGAATLPRGVWLPEIGVSLDAHALPNVWLGVSVENQRYADLRIPHLLDTPAAVRFLSVEPLLGPVTFRWAKWAPVINSSHLDSLNGIDWCIVGGESGHGARPMEMAWVRTLRDECAAAQVPFFFKQWGGRTPKANGRELDGRVWDEYPLELDDVEVNE